MIHYLRDNNGDLIGLKHNNNIYYYQKNIQRDITGILDNNINQRGAILAHAMGRGLTAIARRFSQFECVPARDAMRRELQRKRQRGTVINIQFRGLGRNNFVWSNSRNILVAENGFHTGVLYNGRVHCNIHPAGLAEAAWLRDFRGTGVRVVTRINF